MIKIPSKKNYPPFIKKITSKKRVMKAKKIVIKKSRDCQYYFIAVSRNGKTIITSETYKRKSGVWKGIDAVCKFFTGDIILRHDIDIIDETKN